MISTHLTSNLIGRLEDDFKFKKRNVNHMIDELILADGEKLLYDQGILALETEVLKQIDIVNEKIQEVANTYTARIEDGCKSDLFWRVIDVSVGTGQAGKDVVTLECTKINGSGYRVLDSQIETNQISAGIGSTVAFVGSTGIVTYYPVNKSFGDELIDEGYLDNLSLIHI